MFNVYQQPLIINEIYTYKAHHFFINKRLVIRLLLSLTKTIFNMKKLLSFVALVTFFVTSAFTLNNNSEIYADEDIVDLAVKTEFLSTLVAAVQAGELVDVLKSDGPFTVFAPTNEAFAKLPAGTVENLLKPENKAQLQAVLTFHVVPGKVYAKDLSDGMTAKTAQGSDVTFKVYDGKVKVNGAKVTTADIEAKNGVVHVIDTVILPGM